MRTLPVSSSGVRAVGRLGPGRVEGGTTVQTKSQYDRLGGQDVINAHLRGSRMRKLALGVAAATLLLGTQLALAGAASAQEVPVCGPPGEEVPATIVGAGTIFGTSGDDVIVASGGNDVVFAGNGNDIVCGEGGNDKLDGGKGSDVLIGDQLDSVPFAPSNGANNDTLLGGPGDDMLAGLGGNDTLEGGPGADQLIGMGGVDTIAGGPGDDTAFGGPLNDVIAGGPDNDTLFGNFGSDAITGGPGDDFIDGDNPSPQPPPFPPGDNNDVCSGGPGANVIQNCEITS